MWCLTMKSPGDSVTGKGNGPTVRPFVTGCRGDERYVWTCGIMCAPRGRLKGYRCIFWRGMCAANVRVNFLSRQTNRGCLV